MPNPNTPPKLLDQVRRVKHYSIRTETLYVQWIKRFILFHNKRHPQEMRDYDGGSVFNASRRRIRHVRLRLLFLYKEVLFIDLSWLENVVRAKQPQLHLPVVLTRSEVQEVLSRTGFVNPSATFTLRLTVFSLKLF